MDWLEYLVPALLVLCPILLVFGVLQRWRPTRLRALVPRDAVISGRCMFGGDDWFAQGIGYISDGKLVLTDAKERRLKIAVKELGGVRETLQFPAEFAERLHGFTFCYRNESLWFAVPNHVLWREHVLRK